MRNGLSIVLVGLVAIAIGAGVVLIVTNGTGSATNSQTEGPGADSTDSDAENPYANFRLAGFSLTDQDAREVGPEAFENKVTATVFFFTRCPGPCPLMITALSEIEERTANEQATSGLRFAAISVDGDHDTPEVLTAYAQGRDLDVDRWSLLTGSPELVKRLAQESLQYEVRVQEIAPTGGPKGEPMFNILHPTRIMLIGPDRRLIGIYAYTNADDAERLIADAAAALAG